MAHLVGSNKGAVEVRSDVANSHPESGDATQWNRYFEDLYKDAAGDTRRVPWADESPNPALCAWLNREAPSLIRPGASVSVVGCGLGEDAQELSDRGYDVIAFDVSPTAIQWARQRHPELSERFMVADLFQLPTGLLRRADLVVEISTLQAIHPSLRARAASAIASLARPRGTVLTICRGRNENQPLEHPPYPLTPRELSDLFESEGMSATRSIDDFIDEETPPVRRLRAAFKRA